ncbi:MAG: LacI family DNA-binding transcriptional regulator [Eubacteriales bacterium]|nr:LacI family DNA-binding transcriptional regulator [Eubacteriales bacterium]
MSNITAKEIADKLGVSTAAVSMALNGKPGVSNETREAVMAEAARCGYVTPRAMRAKALPPKTISFVIYVGAGIAAQTTFSTFVLQGVEAAAKELGYRVLIHYLYSDHPIEKQLLAILDDTAGIVLLGTDITDEQRSTLETQLFQRINTPVVMVDNFMFASTVDCVGNDNMFGAKAAVTYLIKCGHKKIGYLRSKQRIANFEDREVGVNLALSENGASGFAPLQTLSVDISSENAYTDVCHWLRDGNTPATAYFAENDVVAAAAIRAFTVQGYRVPEDVSVIGFDDVPICEMMQPRITTTHSFKERLGEVAVSILHQRIRANDTIQTAQRSGTMKIAIATQIKERDSVRIVK